jgi:uncharacterized transporter YbjL
LDYLFELSAVNCRKTEKAKVISFLTGFSESKIEQTFSKIEREKLEYTKKNEFSKKFSDDIEIVRKYFKILKLEKAINKITQDLEQDF